MFGKKEVWGYLLDKAYNKIGVWELIIHIALLMILLVLIGIFAVQIYQDYGNSVIGTVGSVLGVLGAIMLILYLVASIRYTAELQKEELVETIVATMQEELGEEDVRVTSNNGHGEYEVRSGDEVYILTVRDDGKMDYELRTNNEKTIELNGK